MIRLVLFLFFLAALAFGGAWLADRPGEITVVWQGWNIQTTMPVAIAALAVLTAVMMLIWRALSLLVRSPRLVAAFSRRRRREKGWSAVTRGLLAIGTGDVAGARQARAEAARLLPHEPLTHLLSAQTAQFEGNRELAVAHFREMADHANTRLLGLRGLHMEARRAGDARAAGAFAEEAAAAAPALGWAADAVIEARCNDGDYAGAREVLERQMAQKGIDKTQYRRRRAVLLAAEAIALEHADPLVARERAVEAVRLAPTLVPAAAVAGRLLGANGQLKKAAKVVETAFAANPHPELAEVEAHLRPGDAAQDRLKRVRVLAARASGHRESAIALAHAAIDAHEFSLARQALAPLLDDPSQRVCLLMAELEATEHGDIGKAREWTARAVRATRDPAWIADGVVSDHWAPISPISGKLDAFEWAVPPGVSSTPILEHEAERVKAAIAAVRASEEAKAAALAEASAPAVPEIIAPLQPPAADPSGVDAAPAPEAKPPVDAEPTVEQGAVVVVEEKPALEPASQGGTTSSAAAPTPLPEETAAVAAPAEPGGEQTPLAADDAGGRDRVVRLAAGSAGKPRGGDKDPIVAMPPLPDDPGPDPDEPQEPEPPSRRSRFLGR